MTDKVELKAANEIVLLHPEPSFDMTFVLANQRARSRCRIVVSCYPTIEDVVDKDTFYKVLAYIDNQYLLETKICSSKKPRAEDMAVGDLLESQLPRAITSTLTSKKQAKKVKLITK